MSKGYCLSSHVNPSEDFTYSIGQSVKHFPFNIARPFLQIKQTELSFTEQSRQVSEQPMHFLVTKSVEVPGGHKDKH